MSSPTDPNLAHIPYIHQLGVLSQSSELGHSHLILDLQQRHTNKWRTAHGGVLMSLLDVALARAANTADAEPVSIITLEMKVSFLQSGGVVGSRLHAHGHLVHRTRTLAFCEGEIRTDDGTLVARASGTFKPLKPRSADLMKLPAQSGSAT